MLLKHCFIYINAIFPYYTSKLLQSQKNARGQKTEVDMNMHAIGSKIADLRKSKNMTQMELAEKLYVSYQAVSSWERGLTMPEISKLPDISQVLQVSVDELLDNVNHAAIVKTILSGGDAAADIPFPELAEIAPMLRPNQVDSLTRKGGKVSSIAELRHIAPFASKEVLDELAKDITEAGDLSELRHIAPFVSRSILDELAKKAPAGELSRLKDIAPFVSKEVLDELAVLAIENNSINALRHIAPFVSRDILDELAAKCTDVKDISKLRHIAPFVSKKVLDELAQMAVEADELSELRHIAPFVSKSVLDGLILKFINSRKEEEREDRSN